MTVKDIESTIVNKLNQDITDLEVRAFPENTNGYHLKHPKGSVLVHYNSARFNKSLFKEVIIQECTLVFDVIAINRNLRGNNGSYETLEAIRESLTGFELPNCEKMFPTQEDFISEDNGIWQYGIRFQMKTKHVEKDYST